MHTIFAGFNTFTTILLIVGFALVALEMFIPGFGVPGILGGICLLLTIVFTAETFTHGLILFGIIILILILMFIIIIRLLTSSKFKNPVVLEEEQIKGKGYVSSNDLSYLIGTEGELLTDLRPTGYGQFNNKKLDITSNNEFLRKGTKVKVIKVEGSKIIVDINRGN